jgi:hypothetical protein
LLAIEPGVSTVRNEMTVAQPASAAGASSPAGAASDTTPPPGS